MLKRSSLLLSFIAVFSMSVSVSVSRAATGNSELNLAKDDSELSEYDRQIQVQVRLLDEIDHRIEIQKDEIREKSLSYYRYKNTPISGPKYLWMDTGNAEIQSREKALKVLALGLKESVRDLDLLESRRVEAQAELEWTKIQQEEFLKQKPGLATKDLKKFFCSKLPVSASGEIELIQGFGMQKDAETELEWNSLGWWLSAPHEEVVSCAPATVVFVGEISGRGRVVMLDHGAGHLTVYANLNPATVRSLKKGQKLQAGHSLGQSLDRLYFEYRRQGVASNPKNVLRAESLAKVAL